MPSKKANKKTLLIVGSAIAVSLAGVIAAALYQKRIARARSTALPKPNRQQQTMQQPSAPKQQSPTIITKDAPVTNPEPSRRLAASKQAPSTSAPHITSTKEDEISIPAKAKMAQESIKELILASVNEAKRTAEKTGRQIKASTLDIAATADSKDIHSLESSDINAMAALFEDTMVEIQKEGYDEQIILMDAYKKMLQEHIRVIDARRTLAGRLKPGA